MISKRILIDHGCPPDTFGHDGVVHAPDGAAQEGALPGVLGLVTGLMRGTGWTPDTVWALSVGEAEWYLAGVFLHRGVDVGLKTGMDERMEEMLRKRKQREEELSVVSGQLSVREQSEADNGQPTTDNSPA